MMTAVQRGKEPEELLGWVLLGCSRLLNLIRQQHSHELLVCRGEVKPKLDLFRTCVAAIPRLLPEPMTYTVRCFWWLPVKSFVIVVEKLPISISTMFSGAYWHLDKDNCACRWGTQDDGGQHTSEHARRISWVERANYYCRDHFAT